LGEVLGGTGSARLNNLLVKTASVASSVSVRLDNTAGPNLLVAQLLIAPGKDPAQAERLVYEEIDRVVREGVPREEIERMQTEALRRRAFSLVSTTARSQVIGQMMVIAGHAEGINDWERLQRGATSAILQRAARKYLTAANRTVLTLMPTA